MATPSIPIELPALAWRCVKCKCGPIGGASKTAGVEGDTRIMRCPNCGQERFVMNRENRERPKPKTKRVKMMSNQAASKMLSKKAIDKGVMVPKGQWTHKRNKEVMTRLCQLSVRRERVGTSGLLEVGE